MNVLLLKAWLREQGPRLIGARLRTAHQQGPRAVLLELASEELPLWLLISVLEELPVLALVDSPQELPENTATESNFCKALNFHFAGYQLASISQQGFDRSVVFTFVHRDQYGKETVKSLRHELVGRSANAFIISDRGMVVSLFKQVRRDQNRVRQITTGKALPSPPPLGKFVAGEANVDDLASELATFAAEHGIEKEQGIEAEHSLEGFFTHRVAGVDLKLWPALEPLLPVEYGLETLHSFILQLQNGEFTAQLFSIDHEHSANDVALEQWLAQSAKRGGGRVGRPDIARERLGVRLDQLREQLALGQRADEIEQAGLELLRQTGAEDALADSVLLAEFTAAHAWLAEQVSLDKPAYDNAQALIQYAQRQRRGQEKLDELITRTEEALTRLERTPVKAAPRRVPIDPVKAQQERLDKYGVKHLRFVSSDGIHIVVGVNDRSNDGLLKVFGSGRHLWLHARDYPGSHVIVLTSGQEAPWRTIEEAALIAAYYSKGGEQTELGVSYVEIKHLRRPKNAKPGQVLLTNEKVITVRPSQFIALKEQLHYDGA
jgi:predicted ribosome quality control (RQC) complex YloA/Tae2 family protein